MKFVREDCAGQISRYLKASNTTKLSSQWVFYLAGDILSLIEIRNTIKVKSMDYVSATVVSPRTYTDPRVAQPRYYDTVDERIPATIHHVISILTHRFDIADDFRTRARASLIGVLLDVMGPVSLLLPELWDLYQETPRWLFGNMPRLAAKPGRRSLPFEEHYLGLTRIGTFLLPVVVSALPGVSSPSIPVIFLRSPAITSQCRHCRRRRRRSPHFACMAIVLITRRWLLDTPQRSVYAYFYHCLSVQDQPP